MNGKMENVTVAKQRARLIEKTVVGKRRGKEKTRKGVLIWLERLA